MTSEQLILDILHNSSGGAKITHLIVEVVCYLQQHQECPVEGLSGLRITDDGSWPFNDALYAKLEEMEAAGKIGLLKYGWDQGGLMLEKIFIYTPIEQSPQTISQGCVPAPCHTCGEPLGPDTERFYVGCGYPAVQCLACYLKKVEKRKK